MRVLMLVATSVATDTRVLREAATLVADGHEVHIVGKSVPTDFSPPPGVTVSSVGTSSVFRAEGAESAGHRRLAPHLRLARWVLLPQHRNSAFGRWAQGAVADARARSFDVVHAHDFTALEAGATLAEHRGVPLVYDSHELWAGRPRQYRPTPVQDWRERRVEARLGARAAAVVTVGEGVADVLRRRYGWSHVVVVRNTFEAVEGGPPATPTAAVYAGRLAPYRELEVIAQASRTSPLPITLVGPSDPSWLARFEPGDTTVRSAVGVAEVTHLLQEAGIALVTHGDNFDNLRLALPNKAFQAVAAGVPVVATDVGELAALVREHGIGALYAPGDAAGLVRAIESVVADYPRWCAQVASARSALGWEVDAQRLREVYHRVA
ncbi:glycosyltransferase involved in cell wall biosynthesis [Phycicoccus badiiscoriae]|uniref:Glycosyltransferase involved in cell wall biosynthesis n=1 Tax=Pedococcus badiiscoriae TaxID=642776 RepID=A0A852WQY9_9MICO|nr:glycosyltransferase [Pedococcus badiiscoriae]NYG07632.1 glycosyltransferase involved in cell wall biosynthesis [Pedococcus badiiscoriae]